MKSLLHKWRKGLLIGLGALIISTLGIQASDELSGVAGRLSGSLMEADGVCGKYAQPILFGSHTICMDTYEASPSKTCPYNTTEGEIQTQGNIAQENCEVISVPDVLPWRYVNYTQAQQLCARAGKRLPTNEEWYKVAIGLGDISSCVLKSENGANLTGSVACVTPTNIYDLVGNVWEWVSGDVSDGLYNGRNLPESGYVTLVDDEGVVITTAENPDRNFGEDYAWVNNSGVRGILRGGFYGSGSDGGIFSQNVSVGLDFAAVGVGFRCVKDL